LDVPAELGNIAGAFITADIMSRKRRAESLSEPDQDESSDTLSSDSELDSDDGSSGAEEEEELVNCNFEFFDPQKQDFLGIKHLLRQLFDSDADSLDLSALAEMVLAQPLVGTTVKTEGNESDPLSFLTVLNLRVHKVRTCQRPYANLIG
jgi:protein BCP1